MQNKDPDELQTRKSDHLELAKKAQLPSDTLDTRFDFEPLLSGHPKDDHLGLETEFLGKKMRAPLWISSMTGGTKEAGNLNRLFATVAAEFGLGLGLGSCRVLFDDPTRWSDFDLRPILGEDLPFYANLGVAQIEGLLKKNEVSKVVTLVERLRVDGLIIHINPLQEWFQPGGDRFEQPPLETMTQFLEKFPHKVIVKEVGQGFGPRSLEALMKLPLAAIDFGSYGGTNFTKLEMMRSKVTDFSSFTDFSYVGHTADEMVLLADRLLEKLGNKALCKNFIISGGIKNSLHGFYLMNKLRGPCVYAQAKAFLEKGREGYPALKTFVANELRGLALAESFLRIKN
jgi:isopentenyl-diphosphate delta-isomerase